MAYTTINKHTSYFNTKLYTGNGSAGNAQTGVGFQPDWLWIKNRTNAQEHWLADALRGTTKFIESNSSNAESSDGATGLASFDSDGFTVNGSARTNQNSQSMVAWNWKANGQGSSNTAGTINTTYTSANTTAGFSIITYTGNGAANATIGHGLGVEPTMILFKKLTSNNWIVYQKTMGTGHYLTLNTTGTKDSASGAWCTPSSTLIQLNQVFGATNTNGANYVAYCFADKTGYSKVDSYTGNGNADGTFVYTGFKPALIIIKSTGYSENWFIFDNKRPGYNLNANHLNPNDTAVETNSSANTIDILSNGFKMRATNNGINRSGDTFIYMAIGQSLVGSNNIPCTAR